VPTTRLFIEIPPSPCEKPCPLWEVCGNFYLACDAFGKYVYTGKEQEPPKENNPVPANREIYERIYKGKR
jgi:hypothetical protein